MTFSVIILIVVLMVNVCGSLSSVYIQKSKNPKLWISLLPMLLPILIFTWAFLPYNERSAVFEDVAKISQLDDKTIVYYTYNDKLYTKQVEKDKKYNFVYYNEDAGYGRRYDKDYEFLVKGK